MRKSLKQNSYKLLKRIIDIVLSIILLFIFAPIILTFAVIIYIQSGENPFFVQERSLTLEKHRFKIIKLKTLFSTINKRKHRTVFIQSELQHYLIPAGKILRRTGLDEVPQLLNVLFGQMSLIGPRPLTIDDLEIIKSEQPDLYSIRNNTNCLPGITGFWQVYGDRRAGVFNLIELDDYYSKNFSFPLDLNICLKTIPLMLLARHSDAISFSRNRKLKNVTEKWESPS